MDDNDRDVTPIEIGRFARVEHLLAVGQAHRAREVAAEAIAADPNDASSYTSMARVLMELEDREGAIAAAAQAIQLEPEWPSAWRVHAATLFVAGRFADAEANVIEAIRLDPEDGSLLQMYARMLTACGRPAEALDLAHRALELDPDDESAHQLVASLLHEVRPSQWRISEELATRAVSLNPDDSDSFAVLGVIKLNTRRYAEAEEHFRTALELDANNDIAVRGLAQVVMAKNWFYRPFLSYQLLLLRLGVGAQLLVIASLWAIMRIVTATVKNEGVASLLTFAYLGFCVYTWFAYPLTRMTLKRRYPWSFWGGSSPESVILNEVGGRV